MYCRSNKHCELRRVRGIVLMQHSLGVTGIGGKLVRSRGLWEHPEHRHIVILGAFQFGLLLCMNIRSSFSLNMKTRSCF